MRSSRLFRGTLIFIAGALAAGAVALAAVGGGSSEIRKTSDSDGTPIFGLRPTGVGLPLVGAQATVGAGDLAAPLKAYHDSGAYEKDLGTVDGRAALYLLRRLHRRAAAERRCRIKVRRSDEPAARCRWAKPALVLDIDETSLSNYSYLGDFKNITTSLAIAAATATSPAIGPTVQLFNLAKRKGVSVFFITGRPTAFGNLTTSNLTAAGYSGWTGLVLNPGGSSTIDYKSGARAKIEKQGYRIIVNVGDQESDLLGGHAGRAYKLPNPFYFIP